MSRYQKGKTNLDFTEARDSEWQWHQLGRMQVCITLQTDNHASTPPLSFLQAGCPSCRPTNSIKALKAEALLHSSYYLFSFLSSFVLSICFFLTPSLLLFSYITYRNIARHIALFRCFGICLCIMNFLYLSFIICAVLSLLYQFSSPC